MAVSKLILKVEAMGLLQIGDKRETLEFQAMLCSVEMRLILVEIDKASGTRFS
jgi:ABC-type antimicrobial peptide transport system permease subunit